MLGKRLLSLVIALAVASSATAQDDLTASLKQGTPVLESAGSLAFGPNGILFVGDSQSATIFAIATADTSGNPSAANINIQGINGKIADMLGVEASEMAINDLAVNPLSGKVYFAVSRGLGPDAQPVILRVDGEGQISELPLAGIPFAQTKLPNPPAEDAKDRRGRPLRLEAITDLEFVNDRLFIAGLSNEEFSSNLRSIPFPFQENAKGTSVEIYHGAHGQFETNSPVRTFTAYDIGGETNLLCAYTCTPLVKIPVGQLKAGQHIRGTTIAELGNRNRPLDMIVYTKGEKNYILLANSARGVMKIGTQDIAEIAGIENPVRGGNTAGLSYETIEDLAGVVQLDRLNKARAILLVQHEDGSQDLKTIELP